MRKLFLLIVLGAGPLLAQNATVVEPSVLVPNPTMTPGIRTVLDALKANNAWTLQQQRSICEIPAPPFKEHARAAEMKRRFELLGYRNVRIDSVGNVIVERKGTGAFPNLVVAGHLDTVFPEGTDVKVKVSGTRMDGPGISDDCRGLAVLLAVARAFANAKLVTGGTIYFVADVGEEGPGNLRGMRYLFGHDFPGKIDAFISVDGGGEVGSITHQAVGSIRYNVTYHGPGGHSYSAFGTPNPIHALGRAIAAISDLTVPSSPKTTFNVGVIAGGTSVNAIPHDGSAQIDMRSESAEELAKLDARVREILTFARDSENSRWAATDPKRMISFTVDTIGVRPANSVQSEKAPIVAVAIAAAKQLGVDKATLGASSTDANIPMSLGIPAIKIDGGGSDGDNHALTEWYDDGPRGWLGPQWVALVVAIIAGAKS